MDEIDLLHLKRQSDSQDAELTDLTKYIKDLEKDITLIVRLLPQILVEARNYTQKAENPPSDWSEPQNIDTELIENCRSFIARYGKPTTD